MATVNQGTQQRLQIINDYALTGSGAEDPWGSLEVWQSMGTSNGSNIPLLNPGLPFKNMI